MSHLLFAYGALTNTSVMTDRCPKILLDRRADLHGYTLTFRYFADIQPFEGGVVSGVLWRITTDCERVLDLYEGISTGKYIKRNVTVINEEQGQKMDAIAFVMRGRPYQEPPKAAYRDVIAHGYREHGISLTQLNMAVRDAEKISNRQIWEMRKNELDYSNE
jgi:cation transport regulator ChaC